MRSILLILSLLVAGSSFAADSSPWWRLWGAADEVTGTSERLFTSDEKRIIQSYYRQRDGHYYADEHDYDREHDRDNGKYKKPKKKKKLPPGLQKKLERGGELPPGWQKKVARGEVLGSDLYRQSRSLPEELLRQLSYRRDGTELRLLDDRVVRVMDGSRAIMDVMQLMR